MPLAKARLNLPTRRHHHLCRLLRLLAHLRCLLRLCSSPQRSRALGGWLRRGVRTGAVSNHPQMFDTRRRFLDGHGFSISSCPTHTQTHTRTRTQSQAHTRIRIRTRTRSVCESAFPRRACGCALNVTHTPALPHVQTKVRLISPGMGPAVSPDMRTTLCYDLSCSSAPNHARTRARRTTLMRFWSKIMRETHMHSRMAYRRRRPSRWRRAASPQSNPSFLSGFSGRGRRAPCHHVGRS